MAERALRVGVVGCGLAARDLHLPCLAALPGVEIAGLCDADGARAAALASQFGGAVHEDAARMFANESLDFVVLLTPPESHAGLCLAAFDAGLHVLLEKPFCYDVAEADQVVARAAETGRSFSVIHNELFNPSVDAAREQIARGDLGTLCSVQYSAARRHQLFVPEAWYYRTAGGRMGETLPHALCLLVALLDDLQVLHVDARKLGHPIGPERFAGEDFGIDELRVDLACRDGRATAHVWYSFNTDLPTNLIVAGTKGHRVVYPFGRVSELTATPTRVRAELPGLLRHAAHRAGRRLRLTRPKPAPVTSSSHYHQIADFVVSLRSGGTPAVTPHDAREVVRLWQDVVGRYDPRVRAPEAP
ncbi:MAG: Gfo/Idh/MocA family oxidoreductase, partial [Myxococcales bacterium]|nr:Gfo/Idh/MocA family oxidoreductase [Myxococcales bacterium]